MQRLKRNPLYLWFMHQRNNNRIMDSSDNSDDHGDDLDEFISGISNEATNERHNNTPVSSGHNINDSPNPNELTSETYEEDNNEIHAQNELILENYEESTNEIITPTGWKSDSYEEVASKIHAQNELILENYEESTNEIMALTESKSDGYEEVTSEITAMSEWTAVSSKGLSSANCDSSELKRVTCVKAPKESIRERLSRFHDDADEDIGFLNSYDMIKRIVYSLVSSLTFRIFGILLIFVDMSLVITDLLVTKNAIYIPAEIHLISLAISLFFVLDVLLRVYVEGIRLYFSDILNCLDAVIIVVTLLVDIIYMFYDLKVLKDIPRLAILFQSLRLIILIRVFHLAHQKKHLEMLARRLVSENKRRYKKDGFDLDLTYVTERIIAMSFPSSGQQSFYRNPIKEVVRFLDTKHQDHYQVYNLCSERDYDPKYFHYRVRRIMIDDHNVPTLSEMLAFTKEVDEWMAQDDENIIAIHCKGGKGRTGTMACACLIASEIFTTAEDSLYYFGERRTDKTTSTKYQGVETPSQVLPKYYDNCPFFFWFHTSFIQNNRLYLSRNELDNPHKPKTWKIYRPEFAVEVFFDEVVAGT
ncbi:phosphatidylinositol 3,4,5-trisphosphate 3-phosphatase TPTE2-like isoform X5 [Panthera leo]|uniref:phosphatidylinositol 3,4,5-trisphosphate 3-phosphatase TPTE2-like isoform X5 n=1 Tax=Panthera leo TaxID=9689 RepID=UPI001C69E266|nr:phosphatidylinositol 3,4,5-trisphosphate 3-phosphatase TPTE2-like isoform X5 [Panthera leo]